MSNKPSEHDEIIAEAREKYTVHNCGECDFRKSCYNEFDSDECKDIRQSIMLGFGLEDGYFAKLLNRLEAAHKREVETSRATSEKSSVVGNAAKMREALHKARLFAGCCPMPFVEIAMGVVVRDKLCDEIDAALATPPRNCEKCQTADDAMQLAIDAGVVDCGFGAREMAEFLLAEAEGDAE